MLNKFFILTFIICAWTNFSFLHTDIEWSKPTTISTEGDFFIERIVFNKNGVGLGIWEEVNLNSSTLYYSIYENYHWSSPKPITTDSFISEYNFAMNDNGQAVIAWGLTNLPSNHDFIMASFFDGKTWSDPSELYKNSLSSVNPPKVTIDQFGNGLIIWSDSFGNLQACSFENDEFKDPILLTDTAYGETVTYDIAAYDSNNALAAWVDYNGIVQVKQYADSQWSLITDNLTTTPIQKNGGVCITYSSLHPIVLWTTQINDENVLESSSYDSDLKAWSMKKVGTYGTNGDLFQFTLSGNARGGALALWGGSNSMLFASYFDGQNWSLNTTLASNFSFQLSEAQVCLNDNKQGIAVWTEKNYETKANAFDGKSWASNAYTLSSASKYQTGPVIALNDSNEALALWIQGKDFKGNNYIQASVGKISLLEASSKIQILSRIDQNPANSSENRVHLQWTTPNSEKLTRFAIYKDGLLMKVLSSITQTLSDTLHPGRTTYLIEALDSNHQVITSNAIDVSL